MESSCEQILKWTEKVLNGGAITEEEARTLIRTKDEAEQWLEAPPEEAMRLQRPAPDDSIVLLPEINRTA